MLNFLEPSSTQTQKRKHYYLTTGFLSQSLDIMCNPLRKKYFGLLIDNRYLLVLSSDIVDQRVLQSEWTRDKTGYTQPKRVFSGATFP